MEQANQIAAHVSGLTHRYGSQRALDNVSLAIPAGARIGLIGPDGVGKSTLMGLLAGSRQIQTGQVTVLGHDLADVRARERVGPRIAYMPQGLGKNLYMDLTVTENLAFFAQLYGHGPRESASRIGQLTRATGLHPFVERQARALSGGMKQKLGLCCALIHDPDFLILDEPTTGVDPLSRRQFWELINSVKTQRPSMTLIVSTAYMEEAGAFDWLAAMNAGRIIGSGSPHELLTRTGTDDLEQAYIALLPENDRRKAAPLIITERTATDGAPAIVARGLTRRFGSFTAVDNVDFTIGRGEIFGFLGSNGCGKTTTMKMLTGLLAPTQGEAFLFGQTIEAGTRSMRRRVGYMSQSFSLYGELTVRQNFDLHARLFHLPRDHANKRIAELTQRFGLERYAHDLSGTLPLGVRQRLSLAIAILHQPEMLILDEPTSGVDPIARDEFWTILLELSRNENVTIFVSTHFMNEALRCDRISLMHAGKVLAAGKPDDLIASKDAQSLDEAFIAYMQEALDDQDGGDSREQPGAAWRDQSLPDQTSVPFGNNANETSTPQNKQTFAANTGLSVRRLFAYALRETREILRDPVRLGFAFIGSTILLFIFSYGITTDVENVTFAVLDQDQSPASRAYVSEFSGSRYFQQKAAILNSEALERRLKANDVTVAIEIPPSFGRTLRQGGTPEISAWIDGANTMRAATIEGYVAGVHRNFVARWITVSGGAAPAPPSTMTVRYLYNPTFESIYAIGPAVPAMLLILFPAILMAVSVVREKEIGTIVNFYVTPSRRLEFLIGKQLPYVAITLANFVLMALIVANIFGVPMKGSALTLALAAFFYAFAATGYGLLIATFTSSQVAAVFATAILSMMPTFLFSGFLQPVSSLQGGAHVMGILWPTTYYMHASVGTFTKGLGFADITADILALSLFVPAFLAIAAFFLRKQER